MLTTLLLLKPGSQVYVREDDGSFNAYIVHNVKGGVSGVDKNKITESYRVKVWHLAFDGSEIQPCSRRIVISAFDNEREITSLDIFPARFIDDNDNGELEEKLVKCGEKYFAYSRGPTFLQYTGRGLNSSSKRVSSMIPGYTLVLTLCSINELGLWWSMSQPRGVVRHSDQIRSPRAEQ